MNATKITRLFFWLGLLLPAASGRGGTPDSAAALYCLGQLYTRLGRTVDARCHLAAVLLTAPVSSVNQEVRELLENLPE